MTQFKGLRAKTHSCLVDDVSGNEKAKDTKRCGIKS